MFEKQRSEIVEHLAEVEQLEADVEELKERMRWLRDRANESAQSREERIAESFQQTAQALMRISAVVPPSHQPWDSKGIAEWTVAPSEWSDTIRVGSFRETATGELLPLEWILPFVGHQGCVIIGASGDGQNVMAADLLQSLIMRTVLTFPQQSRFTLLDPSGNGIAFPMMRHLPKVTEMDDEPRRILDGVRLDIQRIIQQYLDASTPSFEQIPEELRLNEAYHFVFLADYPNGYSESSAELLRNIAESGPKAGVYTFIHVNDDHLARATSGFKDFPKNATVLHMGNLHVEAYGSAGTIVLDQAPPALLQEKILNRIKAAPPLDRSIDWADLRDDDEIWAESADLAIETIIGRHGANQPMKLWFGYNEREERAAVHGVLGASTGAGKSTLLHNIVSGLAVRYAPDDLRLFLVDGKAGVEFAPYRDLPHAEVVSLRTQPELARSVLQELVDEMDRRNGLFLELGLQSIVDYRRAGSPEGPMPRLLLISDEYQTLFEGDRDGVASSALLTLSEKGRSAGIHMFLSALSWSNPGMQYRDQIFQNFHTRVSMQIPQDSIAALTEFGPRSRRLIQQTCDRAGRALVNDRAGDDSGSVAGKVALITPDQISAVVSGLKKVADDIDQDRLPYKTIINGTTQPDIVDNPFVEAFLDMQHWPEGEMLEEFARGRLRVEDWLEAERPHALFVGKTFDVRGQAMVVLRRRPSSNLVIVGERNTERVAMLASTAMSLLLANRPNSVSLLIGDRSMPKTKWSEVLPTTASIARELGCAAELATSEETFVNLVERAFALVEERAGVAETDRSDLSTVLLVLNEPDLVGPLRRTADDFGYVDSEVGRKLRQVASAGPQLGVHTVISTGSVGALKSALDPRALEIDFRHRIAMQMSEDDSFSLVGNNSASKLQTGGNLLPVSALYYDNQAARGTRFKPYSVLPSADIVLGNDRGSLIEQLRQIAERLKVRV